MQRSVIRDSAAAPLLPPRIALSSIRATSQLVNRHDRPQRRDRIARQTERVQSLRDRKSNYEHPAENDHPKRTGVLISPVREGIGGMAGLEAPADAKNRASRENPEDERDIARPHVALTTGRQLWQNLINFLVHTWPLWELQATNSNGLCVNLDLSGSGYARDV
jgi:hypothetical protein